MIGGPWKNEDRQILRRRFGDWAGRQAAETVRWNILKPTEATTNLPRLSVQADDSIFASGDQSKRDLYTVRFSPGANRITAIRLERSRTIGSPEAGRAESTMKALPEASS